MHTQAVYNATGLPNSIGQTNAVKIQW